MVLTQQPKWESGESRGTGDSIVVSTKPEGMVVKGSAFLNLPADQLAATPTLTGTAAPAARTAAPAKSFAQVYSESYRLAPTGATFQGPVRIQHPEMAWKSGTLSVDLTKDKHSRRLQGDKGVEFDLLDSHGGSHHGTGEKADLISGPQVEPSWMTGLAAPYLTPGATNHILVLTGDPALLTDESGNVRNRLIILDQVRHRVTAPGQYFLWGKGPPISTNKFVLPTGKAAQKVAPVTK